MSYELSNGSGTNGRGSNPTISNFWNKKTRRQRMAHLKSLKPPDLKKPNQPILTNTVTFRYDSKIVLMLPKKFIWIAFGANRCPTKIFPAFDNSHQTHSIKKIFLLPPDGTGGRSRVALRGQDWRVSRGLLILRPRRRRNNHLSWARPGHEDVRMEPDRGRFAGLDYTCPQKFQTVWLDLAKIRHFGKILKDFGIVWRAYSVLGKFLIQLWQHNVCHWAKFHCCEWPNLKT